MTEFGGISFKSAGPGAWGYRTAADSEELLEQYRAQVTALLGCEPVQGFCYTQLADVEQETNGLLTHDRRPKTDPARIRKITAAPRPTNDR